MTLRRRPLHVSRVNDTGAAGAFFISVAAISLSTHQRFQRESLTTIMSKQTNHEPAVHLSPAQYKGWAAAAGVTPHIAQMFHWVTGLGPELDCVSAEESTWYFAELHLLSALHDAVGMQSHHAAKGRLAERLLAKKAAQELQAALYDLTGHCFFEGAV